MSVRGRWVMVAMLALAWAWAPAVAWAQLASPGPLSAAHAKLEGDGNCTSCHEAGKKVSATRCLDCHKDLRARIDAKAGWHGRQAAGKPCEQCHVEHIGRGTKLIRWPGGDMGKLDHTTTGWALEGKHVPVTCLKCHTAKSPLGKAQFVGTSGKCASCHTDPHQGAFGNDCTTCHTVSTPFPEFKRTAFKHDLAAFKLTGKHVAVDCAKCHQTPPKWKGIEFKTCESCHADPHAGEFKPKPCTACHDTNGWAGAEAKMRGNHPGLSLANGHAKVACERCHDRGNVKPPSKGKTCVGCHRPVHEAAFGDDCIACHKAIKWTGLPEAVGRQAHPKTPFPLIGKHAEVACAACHPKSKPAAARYRQLEFATCTGCHADQHAGEFAARNGGDCAQCHREQGFTPTTFGPSHHATTAFVLDGRHLATPCSGCHTQPTPRVDLRLPGKQACVDCHANPHGTQFAREMAQGGCAQCHSTADWAQPTIDHKTWPLTGAHAQAACARCHGTQTAGNAAAFRGVPRDCTGCHEDPHAGQFAVGGPVKTCTDCHDTTRFQLPGFTHATQTGFALEGKHAAAACASCHAPEALRNGLAVVRYRLGYRACKDCHANPHGGGK